MGETCPRISIGMPLFNGERYVREALDSLLGQSFGDFELIISDNASDDETEAICRSYAVRDERIRYVRNDVNLGAAKNFNQVFALARAPYFKWAAYDDRCARTFLERCVRVLDDDPGVILAYPRTCILDAAGAIVGTYVDDLDLPANRPYRRLHKLVRRYQLSNAFFGLIRSDALRRTKLVGPYVASDYILLVEMCLYGRFREIPEYLFERRDHARNVRRLPMKERALWFDPRARRIHSRYPFSKLLGEQLAAVVRAPLSIDEKLLCWLQIAVWALQRGRDAAGRYKAAVRSFLAGRRLRADLPELPVRPPAATKGEPAGRETVGAGAGERRL